METILTSTDSVSKNFTPLGLVAGIHLSGHAGDSNLWVLQSRVQGGPWVSTNMTFDQDDVKGFDVFDDLEYRLTGGTAGATATLVEGRRQSW